jgi:nicotinic acid phosphoribosyltransferase
MGQSGSPASNIVYDLVSVQYHALKGAQVYDQFISDAQDNDKLRKFFEQVKQEDEKRAQQCHELLTKVTKDGGISNAA